MSIDLTLYKGREQTLAKHEIFGRYLQRFSFIVGSRWDSITYVDGFSGPWEQKSDDFRDTSFGIAIKHLREARDTVERNKKGKHLKLRCFFVEKDPKAYEKLERHAVQQRGPDIEIVTFKGEFEHAIPAIVDYVSKGGPNTFPFFFIDPTGWTGFAMDKLTPIFNLRRAELMINFMTGHAHRFIKTDPSFSGTFGIDVRPQLQELEGLDLEDKAVELYSAQLRKRGGFNYVVPAIVLKPGENRTHFHMVYATRHPKGLEVFKDAEKGAVSVMNEARAGVQIERAEGSQGLLFDAVQAAPESTSYFDDLRYRYTSRARERVRQLLLKAPETQYDAAWVEAVQWFPYVWGSDLKDWIKAWRKAGELDVPSLQHREKVPKLNAGHRLRRIGPALT